jgi:hypothetical protein
MVDIYRMNPPTGGGGTRTAEQTVTVSTRYVDWLNSESQWRRVSHVLSGTDSVRANARDYIAPTNDQKTHMDMYEAAIARTPFTNFTVRAVDGLLGLIFRKEPMVTAPLRYAPRLDNLNNAGDGFDIFCKKVTREVLTYGRVGILVDYIPADDQRNDDPVSMLPYISIYGCMNITNWRTRVVRGQPMIDQVILHEQYSVPLEFGSVVRSRYKVLELDEKSFYRVRIYENNDDGEFYVASEIYPTKIGKLMTRIPFVFVSPVDLSPDVQKSPILDLVDANLAHFYRESEYASALHFSAQPTPVIENWPEGTPASYRFGGGNVWLLPTGCKASILEFQGAALEPLEKAILSVENHIADLGARLLQNAATGPETAEAARIRQHSQTSVVGSIARTVSDGIKLALEIAVDWSAADGSVEVELNRDYIDTTMDPQLFQTMITAHNEGLLTKRDLLWAMDQAELLEPGKTLEERLHELERQGPNLIGLPDPRIMAARVKAGADQPLAEANAAPADRGKAPR